MATVPAYGQRRVRQAPIPGVRRQASETFESLGGRVGEAQAQLGAQVARVGLTGYSEIQETARRRADDVALLEAERQLGELEVQLLHSQDKGALNVKGKAVLPLRDDVLRSFDEQAGMIESNLGNDRQRLAFQGARQRRRLGVLETVEKHTVQQLNAYETSEAQATLANAVNLAVTNFDNPRRISEELGTIDRTVDGHGERMGMGPEARGELKDKLRSQVHEGVITRLLANEKEPAARAYFEELRGQISGEAITRIEDKLKSAGTERQAITAADDIWAAHAPADDDDPISLDVMETAARERFREQPDVLKATIAELRQRKAGVDSGRKERDDARDDAVWTAVMNGGGIAQVRRMPEFIAMSGKAQTAVRDYFQREAEHRESLAYTRAQRELAQDGVRERHLERAGWSEYWRMSDPQVLSTMTRADILRQLPVLGRDHVNRLLTDQEQLSRNGAAVRNATIDTELFKDIVYQAGLEYVHETPSKQTEGQRANLGQLRAFVEGEIARRQQGANRPLTYEEKRTLMQELIDQKVMLRDSGRFWFDAEVPAALVRDDGASRAYVPMTSIPPAAQTEALNYLRGLNPRLSDAELRARYRDRIERAYAFTLLRRSRREVEAILKGDQ